MADVLALDLALTTGWAARADTGMVSGVVNLRPGRGRPHRVEGLNLWWWLSEMYFRHGFERVVQEKPIVYAKRPSGARVAFGLAHACQMWCEHKGVQWETVTPAELKSHATGKGNATKASMLEAARKRWPGHGIADDNEADALWLLDWCRERAGD